MAWQSSMGPFSFIDPNMARGVVDEDGSQNEQEDDFYGDTNSAEDTRVGAAQDEEEDDDDDASGDLLSSLLPQHPPQALPPQTPQPKTEQLMTAEEKKLENQRTAQRLRAQLLAKRQNTPIKAATPRAETPSKLQVQPAPQTSVKAATSTAPGSKPHSGEDALTYTENVVVHGQASQDDMDLDSLIANAKRTAEAKANEIKANGRVQQPLSAPATSTNQEVNSTTPAKLQPKTTTSPEKSHPTQLNDAYYADLPAWLELTGYHDVEYRTSKLRTRRERKALEDEVARIQAKLDQLKEQEAAEMQALRTSVAHPTSSDSAAPPPLPAKLPSDDAEKMAAVAANLTNGVKKRAHSPPPPASEKNVRRREDAVNGFRIRGANGSPTSPRHANGHGYNDYRRSSFDARSRDSSLERRQSYYRREGVPPPPSASAVYDRYDPYSPRDGRSTPGSYGSGRGNHFTVPRGGRGRGSHYRGAEAGARRDVGR